MKKACKRLCPSRLENQHGVTIILVAILMFVFLGIAALAIDLSVLYVAGNELQNAADAGALAGARFLYNTEGTVNAGANQIARDGAVANRAIALASAIPVEVNWPEGTDVQRGHWSFGLGGLAKGFTPNDSLAPVDLWDRSTESLDADTNFINAVKVVTRRQAAPVASFFSRIFGHEGFERSAEAVAYIGFAGSLRPEDVDQPIAICRQSILDAGGNFTCGVGRMVTDSSDDETAAWTDFGQPEVCRGGASSNSVGPYVCKDGNPNPIVFGRDMQVINGQVHTAFKDFWDCWWDKSSGGTQPWQMTLPVIDCSKAGGGVDPCEMVRGAVTVNVIWVNDKANTNPKFLDDAPSDAENARPGGTPLSMAGFGEGTGSYESWSADISVPGVDRWASFVNNFNLQINAVNPIDGWTQKTIYFVPSCEPHEPIGNTGGENYGILAAIPVLVQ